MALDVLTIPPMSDEPERKFSEAGDVTQPRRRRIKDDTLQSALALKCWQKQGLITIDRTLFRRCQASREPSAAPIHLIVDDDDDEEEDVKSAEVLTEATTRARTRATTPSNDSLLIYDQATPID